MARGPWAVLLGVLLALGAGCSALRDDEVTLRVLASPELADMQPILDDLRRATGITLELDYRGSVTAASTLNPGDYGYDLAWLSTDRYLKLRLESTGYAGPMPLASPIMDTPVVVGLTPAAAGRLRAASGAAAASGSSWASWADVADAAAGGELTFGMADPGQSGSGLAALIGVATAATGAGRALGPQDVTCDRLGGFLSGQQLSTASTEDLTERYKERSAGVDALVTYESSLLTLNESLPADRRLELLYPRDGMVLSDYPLLLLEDERREAYDRAVAWLRNPVAQRAIMDRTLRRPLDAGVERDPRLSAPIGNSLYFPDEQAVIDKLLTNYGTAVGSPPGAMIFVLDYSGSMRGARLDRLRSTFAGLGGADRSPSGKFTRFFTGEQVTVVLFGGTVLGERSVTVARSGDVGALDALLASDDLDGSTAVWSALDHAYDLAAKQSGRRASIVLMTDGENNAGIGLDEFTRRFKARAGPERGVHTYAIGLGEADQAELGRVATLTGGRVLRATTGSLQDAFKDVRGCG